MIKLKIVIAIFILSAISFVSCKKNNNDGIKHENTVEGIAKHFLNNENYAIFFKSAIRGSFAINKAVSPNNIRTSSIDSSLVYNKATDLIASQIMLEETHPNYESLTLAEKIQVNQIICDSLASITYRTANFNSPLVIEATEILDELNSNGPNFRSTTSIDITWGEFMACTVGAIGTALGEYGGILGQIKTLLTGPLTWNSVWNISKTLIKEAVPWWKVVSVAIGYATCLWAAA